MDARNGDIRFIDLWIILARRKIWVGGVFFVILVIFVAASLLISPLYESRAVIAIGHVGKDNYFEQTEMFVERLKQLYRVGEQDYEPEPPYVSNVAVDARGSKQVALVKAVGVTPEDARKFLLSVTNEIIQNHQQLFEQAVTVHRGHLAAMEEELGRIEKQVRALDEQIVRVKAIDAAAAVLVALERSKLLTHESALRAEYTALRLSLMPPQTEPTRFLGEPSLPVRPARPASIYISLGIFFGLALGIFAAFFADFLDRLKQEVDGKRYARSS